MRGLVIKTTGSSYVVRLDDGSDVECHIKGNFRIRGIRNTNPVAVGDWVEVQVQADGTRWITTIEPRQNYIIRKSTNLSKETHILAANIDQAALIITVNHPKTSTTFIDRFLATCEAYQVPAILIFNKIDLLSEDEKIDLEVYKTAYSDLGYSVITLSAKTIVEEGFPQDNKVKSYFAGKKTLLSGNSGVGKSTFINAMLGKSIARTGEISDAHNKGMHTTTFSEMYFMEDGALIDIPGIKGFGTFDMKREEVGHYFREIFHFSHDCFYGNCTHTDEPKCAVLDAVEKGDIAFWRYESYLSILNDINESKYR